MARHSRTAFTFGPELRARLRLLRKRSGLTLRAMTALMDRQSPGAHAQLSRLERGKMPYPTFNFVMDYLRTCRARVNDVADVLDSYLQKPPVLRQKGDAAVAEILKRLPEAEQRAMLKWEKGLVEARETRGLPPLSAGENGGCARPKKNPETTQQRVFRVIWSFIHANWNEVFEQKLFETMLELKNEVPRSRRKYACNHARRFFSILTRYYRHEARRQAAFERVRRQAEADGFSERVVAELIAAATAAHHELAVSGRLDWQPTEEEIIKQRGHAPKVEKAETRLEMTESEPGLARNRTLSLIRSLAIQEVAAKLDKLRLAHHQGKEYYYYWIDRLIPIADRYGADSTEWQAEVEATVPKLHDPRVAREAAVLIADVFNRWKVKLPPKPTNPA
jgi:transcriptional regulator with XRE-family HTH domain